MAHDDRVEVDLLAGLDQRAVAVAQEAVEALVRAAVHQDSPVDPFDDGTVALADIDEEDLERGDRGDIFLVHPTVLAPVGPRANVVPAASGLEDLEPGA